MKQWVVIRTRGVKNNVDFLSLSHTRSGQDIREGLVNFDEVLQEASGIILARRNLRIDLPPEKIFLFQKAVMYKCNMAGKPVVVTRVVDSMTDNLRPTRAEATDVANVVLDGKLIAKYMPTMPVLSVVIPHLKTNQLRWTFTGGFEVNKSTSVILYKPMFYF
ncbi:putative pyruvate kinase [Helianthus anomalus]